MFKMYSKFEIECVAFELKNEKAVILPTDTLIGIACLKENLIYKIKARARTKKIIRLVPSIKYLGNLNQRQKEFLNQFWPGGVSIIHNNISYRMPNDEWLLLLLSKTGPLFCSSANISNEDVIKDCLDANKVFDSKWEHDLVLVEGEQKQSLPSTIIDIDSWTIIREGAFYNEIKEYLNEKGIEYGENKK